MNMLLHFASVSYSENEPVSISCVAYSLGYPPSGGYPSSGYPAGKPLIFFSTFFVEESCMRKACFEKKFEFTMF